MDNACFLFLYKITVFSSKGKFINSATSNFLFPNNYKYSLEIASTPYISINASTINNNIVTIHKTYFTTTIPPPNSQCALNALAIDEPMEYARLVLDGEMQAWID